MRARRVIGGQLVPFEDYAGHIRMFLLVKGLDSLAIELTIAQVLGVAASTRNRECCSKLEKALDCATADIVAAESVPGHEAFSAGAHLICDYCRHCVTTRTHGTSCALCTGN